MIGRCGQFRPTTSTPGRRNNKKNWQQRLNSWKSAGLAGMPVHGTRVLAWVGCHGGVCRTDMDGLTMHEGLGCFWIVPTGSYCNRAWWGSPCLHGPVAGLTGLASGCMLYGGMVVPCCVAALSIHMSMDVNTIQLPIAVIVMSCVVVHMVVSATCHAVYYTTISRHQPFSVVMYMTS